MKGLKEAYRAKDITNEQLQQMFLPARDAERSKDWNPFITATGAESQLDSEGHLVGFRVGAPGQTPVRNSGFWRSLAASAAQSTLDTLSGIQRYVANNNLTSAEFAALMDRAIARKRAGLEAVERHPAARPYTTAEDHDLVRRTRIDLQRLEGEKRGGLAGRFHPRFDQNTVARRASGSQFATELAEAADGAYEYYDADPRAKNFAAQTGRGTGKFFASAPAIATGIVAAAGQGAAEAYGRAYYDTDQALRAEGETNEGVIREESMRAASDAAVKTAPQLAAYMLGGKLSAAITGRLLPAGSNALTQFAAQSAGATAGNLTVGTTLRLLAGDDWKPTVESLTTDVLYGIWHGTGVWRNASPQARERARVQLNALRQQGRLNSSSGEYATTIQTPEMLGKRHKWHGHSHREESRKAPRLPPNETFTEAGYTYRTDAFGRPVEASGLLRLGEGKRNRWNQKNAGNGDGRLPTDHGAHLIGHQFLGSSRRYNVVPMDRRLNGNSKAVDGWGRLEYRWRSLLLEDPNFRIWVQVTVEYKDKSARPTSFRILEKIGGCTNIQTFSNNPR